MFQQNVGIVFSVESSFFFLQCFLKLFLRKKMPTTCSKQGKLWKWNEFAALENMAIPVLVKVKRHWCLENIGLELKRDWCSGEHCFLPYLFENERILLPNFLSSPMTWSFSLSKRLSFFTCLEGVCTLPLVSFHWALNYCFSKVSCFSVTIKVHLGACFVDFDEGLRVKQNE